MILYSWQYAFFFTAVGILVGCWQSQIPGPVAVVISMGLLLGGWMGSRFYQVLFIVGFISLGWVLSNRILPLPPVIEPITTVLTGTVEQIPARQDDYQQTLIKCAEAGYYQKVILYLPVTTPISLGDTVQVSGKLSTIKGARNPNDPPRRQQKGFQHIYYQLKADDQGVQVTRPAAYSLRQYWYDRFVDQAAIWIPAREASILTSIIWGDAAGLNDDDYRLFQEIGLLHVFAASGMNVGCLMLAAALLTGLFSRRKLVAIGVGLTVTGVYAALIGWPVSVLRAALMALLASLAYWGGRQLQLKESLFLAATVLLAIDPGWLFTPGYQLTLVATWGIMVLYPALASWWLPNGQNWWQRLLLPLLAAELAVWPLTVYYFNLVAPISLLANLLLAILISGLVVLGTLALFTCPLPVISMIFWLPSYYLLKVTITVTTLLHTLPSGHWWVKAPAVIIIFGYYSILWLLSQTTASWLRLSAFSLLIITLLTVSWPRIPTGSMQVTFLDVGQGDCIHISTANGRQVLVDGGGSAQYPVGRLIVMPYLHRQGINKLDLAINTHPHDDHALGLVEALKELPCPSIALSRALQGNVLTDRVLAPIAHKIKPSFAQSGDFIQLDDHVQLQVLSPAPQADTDVNNSSLVLLLHVDEQKILLMGDAEAPVAESLLSSGLSEVNVIKIGHHGSARSEAPDFYRAIMPQVAVISVGKNNGFGHPAPALVKDLENQGIKVLRTDLVGGIRLTISEGVASITTYARN